MLTESKREKLIKTAQRLFSEKGFHAVGIDTIVVASGVSKRTLYKYFKSKDELILAVLRYYDEKFRNQFMRSVEERAQSPEERLLAIYDFAEDWFNQEDYYGCLFVGAIGEFPEEGTAIRNICKDFKGLILNFIYGLVVEAKLKEPRQLAEKLLLLFEGAIAMAQINKSPFSATQAKAGAEILIKHSLDASDQEKLNQ